MAKKADRLLDLRWLAGLTLILVTGGSPGCFNVSICGASRGFVVSVSGRQRRVESPSPLPESRPRTEVFFLQLPPSSKLRQSARRQRLVSEMPCTCSSHVLRKPARLKLNCDDKTVNLAIKTFCLAYRKRIMFQVSLDSSSLLYVNLIFLKNEKLHNHEWNLSV